MSHADELLIGTSEAAVILGVSPVTVTRRAKSGELPYIRKLPGENGAYLFDAGVIRRAAQQRFARKHRARA